MDILSIIVIAIVVLSAIVFLVYKIKKDGLREVAIQFIVLAEEKFEYGKNSDKFNYVFNAIEKLIPSWLKFIFTRANLVAFIENVFEEIKVALNYRNTVK